MYWSGSGTSGEPTARRVRGVSTWCSRSVHVVHVVADQEHSDCAVPRYRYRTELVWRFVMQTAHVLDSTFKFCKFYFRRWDRPQKPRRCHDRENFQSYGNMQTLGYCTCTYTCTCTLLGRKDATISKFLGYKRYLKGGEGRGDKGREGKGRGEEGGEQ